MSRTRVYRWSLLCLVAAASCEAGGAQSDVDAEVAELGQGENALRLIENSLGGREALSRLNSFSYFASGQAFFPNQAVSPGAEPLHLNDFAEATEWDVAGDRGRLDVTRNVLGLGPLPNAQQAFSMTLAGNLGRVVGNENVLGVPSGNLSSDGTAAARREQRLLNPQLLLRDAQATGKRAALVGVSSAGGERFVDVALEDGVAPIVFRVRLANKQLSRLTTRENDQLTRDVELAVTFSGWQQTAGVHFPREVLLSQQGKLVRTEQRTELRVNAPVDRARFELSGELPVFNAADAARGTRSHQNHQQMAAFGLRHQGDGVQTAVVPVELAPGVTLITGSTHNSLVVEQSSGLVLIEAPLYEERSEALLAYLRTAHPSKRLTHVVATHWHVDHAGGLRRFAAAGATIVVSEATRTFWEKVFTAPSTIVADVMSGRPVRAKILTVSTRSPLTLQDRVRPVTMVPINNSHAADMLAPYLPNERIIMVADLYSPPFPPLPTSWAREFYDAIVAQHLDVATIVGVHGTGPGTFDDLKRNLGIQ